MVQNEGANEADHTAPMTVKRSWWDRLMLAVLVLILVVFGLFMFAFWQLFTDRYPLRDKSVMKDLEIGIRGYKTEYLRLPILATDDRTVVESRGPLLAILVAERAERNPRKIVFWQPPPFAQKHFQPTATKNTSGEWELRDSRGNFYRIHLDVDQDGKIPNPAKGTGDGEPDVLASDVILYSAGRDGDFATWRDNLRSWK